MTVSFSEGRAPMGQARKLMPRNKVARIKAIQSKVTPALRLRGARKAVTPFEMASTPVRAVVPFANACRRRKRVRPCSAPMCSMRGGSMTRPNVPVR